MKTVEQILNGFDFEKAHKAMEAVDWKWYHDEDGSMCVPTVYQMINHARKLLEKIVTEPNTKCLASGGFWVKKEDADYITLQFVVDTSFAKQEVVGHATI